MNDSIHDLFDRGAAGDRDAIGQLLMRFEPDLRQSLPGLISARWNSEINIDDLLQMTYLDVVRSFQEIEWRGEAAFLAWLNIIAKSTLQDAIRKLLTRKRGGFNERIEASSPDSYGNLFDLLGGVTATPSKEAATREARVMVEQALLSLRLEQRQVIQLYDLDGRTPQEVADVLGISESAMFMRRKRALIKLTEILGTKSKYF